MKHIQLFFLLTTFAFAASAQNVGIGNATPLVPLSFASTLGNKISLYGNTTTNVYGFGVQGGLLQLFADNAASNIVFGYGSSTAFTERMRIMGNGNVGIGINIPTAKLHVNGTMKITDGTQGLGKVLTSDANGLATWATPTGIGWSASGADIYNSNAGNVGVGTNAPAYILDVNSRMRIRHNGTNTAGIWLNKSDNTEGSFIGNVNDTTLGFWGPAGAGSYKAVIDVKNGAVGIGVLDPKVPLSFESSTGNKISLYGNNTTNVYGLGVQGGLLQVFSDNASSDIGFGYGSSTTFTEKMRVKGNGNVGIGTNNPTATLDVVRGTGTDGTARFLGSQYASHFNYSTGEDTYIRGGKAGSEVFINDQGTGNVRIARLGGNVGIGTPGPPYNPRYKLTVRKEGIGISQEDATGTNAVGFVATSSSGWVQTHTVTPLYLAAGNPTSPHMKIETNGNVGIGTAGTPTAKLEVAGQIKITGGNPGSGRVLTSDAAGQGTWLSPATANTAFHASASGSAFNFNHSQLVQFADNASTQDFDDGPGTSFYNSGSAFYAPAGGVYVFDFAVYFGHTFTYGGGVSKGGSIRVTLRKNDTVIKTVENTVIAGYPIEQTVSGSATVKLLANDVITVYFANYTDINKDIISDDGSKTYFTGYRLY